jgi:hypothetical protein
VDKRERNKPMDGLEDEENDNEQTRLIMAALDHATTTTKEDGRHEVSSASGRSSEDAQSVVQRNPKRSWRSYVWDTLDKSPEERRFLFKLDAVLLTFAYFSPDHARPPR